MIDTKFGSTLRRVTTGRSRRQALIALGSGAVATVAGMPHSGVAAKSSGGKKARKRCKAQVAPCQAVIRSACDVNDPTCIARLLPCCDPLGTCDAGSAIQCIANNAGGN